MTPEHPITPPPELLQQWSTEYWGNPDESTGLNEKYIATQAARWSANRELDECLQLLDINGCPSKWIDMLRDARRPKPPSLAEQALTALDQADEGLSESEWQQRSDTIRCALELLQELEQLND